MTAHERVAAYVRRTCPDADELLLMLGVVNEHGSLLPDDDREIDIAAAGPEVRKSAALERPDDIRTRPKESTAPDALRHLPAIVVPIKPKPKPKPKRVAKPKPERSGPKRSTTPPPCGTYEGKKRHKRRKEPVCDECAPIPLTAPGDKERKARYRRAAGIKPRNLAPAERKAS